MSAEAKTTLCPTSRKFILEKGNMPCKQCSTDHQSTFSTEMNIHFPGRDGPDKPTVWVFPKVVLCVDCGFAELVVPKNELHAFVEGLARLQTKSA
jgi:hypothetical protein